MHYTLHISCFIILYIYIYIYIYIPRRRCLYFDGVAGLTWSEDPESYARSCIATGRGSHTGQVKGDDPDKNGYPGPPCWGLGVGLTTPPCKIRICLETSTEASEEEERGRLGRP
jgi:hypothetical protein